MSIVTKTGDTGTTSIVGGGRISKSAQRLNAYGTIDELNALLGVAAAELTKGSDLLSSIARSQQILFRVGADLATPLGSKIDVPRTRVADTEEVERWIHDLEPTLSPLTKFILPGGSRAGALLHLARTVCRRAEREVITLGEKDGINPQIPIYLNRLGDYLFLGARTANRDAGAPEIPVIYN